MVTVASDLHPLSMSGNLHAGTRFGPTSVGSTSKGVLQDLTA